MHRDLIALLLVSTAAFAQSTGTATIVGAVSDSTGAVVAGAKITVVNTETAFVYESATGTTGDYYTPNLIPGTYRLTIEAAGFKKFVRDGILLRINERPRIDVTLELGSVTESVQVSGAPPLLETETSATGKILDGETIIRTPVMQKFVHRILLYLPGTSNINGQHVVGQRERSLGLTIDGVSGKEPVRGEVGTYNRVMTATLDALQEVKLWTTGMPAEFGHNGGGLLSAVFKSGTNSFHGSAEDRYLNGKLVHRQYFEQLKRTEPFTYHEMSATAGAPVIIPKIYNGKDRTFFFWGFQRHHEKVSETFIGDVPNPAMYGGDFSFGGQGFPIYDPDTTRQTGPTTWTRDPFAGNRIPTARFDPVARNLLGRNPWKPENSPGVFDRTGPRQNVVIPTKGRYYFTRFDHKVDHQFSAAHKIFGRYSHLRHRNLGAGRISNEPAWSLVDPNAVPMPIDQGNAVVSDTYTFSPTMINEVRLGFNRRHFTRAPESLNQDWAKQLGIPNVGPETFPQFVGGGSIYYNMGPGGLEQEVAEDFLFQNNLTKIVGRHTFKGGYELLRTRYNALRQALPSGTYNMGGTELPFTPNTGHRFANLLLGTVASATFTTNTATWLPRWWSHAFYFQDDYKPVRNLTLNLGLRWSYESPFSTKYGQQSQFDPAVNDPSTGRPGAIVHRPGLLGKRDLNNFQPRLGVAWNFRPGFVFRGNFGMITSDLFTNGLNQNLEEYTATANVAQLPGDPRHVFRLSQGPPAYRFDIAPDGSVPYVGSNYGARGASWYDPNLRSPYIMNWSGGIQWEFAQSWLTEVTYQGASGVGLLNNWDINVVPLNVSSDPARLETIRTQYQNFRPYTQFGGLQHYSNYGHNSYHAATFRLERRHSSGLTINSFYTYSKALDEADNDGGASGVTFYNRSLEKGRANYDIRHRIVAIAMYELPFGKGRRHLNSGGWKNALFGGWDIAWIQTIQTGPPMT
ncbi:MAG: carboxypeptidase regulatory-like domain-containing protein, partial [Bryobacteraceae bacterium]